MDSRETADRAELELDPANQIDPLASAPPAIAYPLRPRDESQATEEIAETEPSDDSNTDAGEPRSESEPATASTTPPVSAPGHPERTLEWARAFTLPFKNSEAYGKPLGEIALDGLSTLAEWIAGKQLERGVDWHADTFAAIQLLIKDAESQQHALPLDDESDDTPPPVSNKLAPGKVQDALELTTKSGPENGSEALATNTAAAPAAPVKTLGELAATAAMHLRDPKFTADERAQYKKKYDSADTVEKMAALVADLERFLAVPF
jgi:hypothetical protein